ncbi:MAG TPA: hypothetical protein VFS25_00855 [Chitinophaga sp.]|uniref:hypothetical protein n=1 Tax=Chitinophaga sp. TaxID=1869181 RepID=UPI002DBEEA67|nr:hypothetical protein [Chitinophaga sp.]HEU4551344.1 hypothetical protein [Chitinophaga sp.]
MLALSEISPGSLIRVKGKDVIFSYDLLTATDEHNRILTTRLNGEEYLEAVPVPLSEPYLVQSLGLEKIDASRYVGRLQDYLFEYDLWADVLIVKHTKENFILPYVAVLFVHVFQKIINDYIIR